MTLTNNQRIAKNTIYLYIRTFVVLIVSLYTSRLVLEVLGVTDLGIYNLVGGVVSLMNFIQTAQINATSRFITYEMGVKYGKDSQKRVFSLCMTIHIVIAFIFLLLSETIGLFIINKLTDIPQDRYIASNIVYQFSIISFIIHFLRVPYDSIIIAHENMSVYAYMSFLEVLLKLIVILVLVNVKCDVLIMYSLLLLISHISLFLLYKIYIGCKYKFYKFTWMWDKTDSKRILLFSGWTFLGSSSEVLSQQSVSILFNNFVGLVANTALGFTNQVNSAVKKFVHCFTTAFNPQITKLYAQNDIKSLHILINRSSKISFALCFMITLPLIINMDYVLSIWLKEVPLYTTEFCQLILVCSTIDATSSVFNKSIMSTGTIRNYQIAISCSFLLDVIFCSILLLNKFPPSLVYGSRIFTRGIINMIIGLHFTKKLLSFSIIGYLKEVLLPIVFVTTTSIIFVSFVENEYANDFYKFCYTTLCSIIYISITTIFILMKRKERKTILAYIKSKITKHNK